MSHLSRNVLWNLIYLEYKTLNTQSYHKYLDSAGVLQKIWMVEYTEISDSAIVAVSVTK